MRPAPSLDSCVFVFNAFALVALRPLTYRPLRLKVLRSLLPAWSA